MLAPSPRFQHQNLTITLADSISCKKLPRWFPRCTHETSLRPDSGDPEGTLTVIYSAEGMAPKTTSRTTALMPLLVVLFVISYCILTLLVFEQGQTIEAQRGLIKEMLKDSSQLAAMKEKLAKQDAQRPQEKSAVSADHKNADSVSKPNGSAPSANGGTVAPVKPGKTTNSRNEVPGKPPADLQDVRRLTHVI
jgi:hypothetical protein